MMTTGQKNTEMKLHYFKVWRQRQLLENEKNQLSLKDLLPIELK